MFTYLGANQDAFNVGRTIGIRRGLCANIETSSRGMDSSYATYGGMLGECKTKGAINFLSDIDNLSPDYMQEKVNEEMEKTEE